MFCPQCGTQMNDDNAFCPACGADVRPTAAPAAAPMPPQPAAPPAAPVPPQPVAPASGYAVPYTKAPLGGRLLAVMADSLIGSALLPLAILLVYADIANGRAPVLGGVLAGVAGIWQIAYTLGRDGVRGAGFGKRMTGLVVVSAQTGAPTGIGASAVRQLILWLLGIVPVIGSLVEPILVIADKDGRRLGDKAAKTQVARSNEVAARGFRVATGKGLAIVVLVLALLVSIVGGVVGGLVFAKAVQEAADSGIIEITDSSTKTLDDATDDDATVAASNTPEQAVDDFYWALANGDSDAALAALSEELAADADPSVFEGWTTLSYETGEVTQDDDFIAYVEVEEYNGEIYNGLVTYTLVLENGSWKIDAWTIDGAGDNTTGDAGVGTDVLDSETAIDTVGTLLVALQNDDIDTMRSVSTAYFQDAQSWFFEPSSNAFIDFEITQAFPDGAVWIVGVQEDWNSGPEETYYIVIDDNGQIMVDDLYYE